MEKGQVVDANIQTMSKHSEVHQRIISLIGLSNHRLDKTRASIVTEFSGADGSAAPTLGKNMVRVSINYTPTTYFLNNVNLNIMVSSTAPYLYPEANQL